MNGSQSGGPARHLAIVGPTGAGKSRIAMQIAHEAARRNPQRSGGRTFEIVSVDSMCVYRSMDVGTAKPSIADRSAVPHHMVDCVDPWTEYSLSLFQTEARAAMASIEGRGRCALLVGGTGLYLRALVDALDLPGRYPAISAELEEECRIAGPESLHRRLRLLDPLSASRMQPTNTRRVVRALEVTIGSGRPFSSYGPGLTSYPKTPVAIIGIDSAELDDRIARRVSDQMEEGFLAEVRGLLSSGRGLSRTAAEALGYRELAAHLRGETSLSDAVAEIVSRTRSFARRQRRWFRRDPRIRWFDAADQVSLGDLEDLGGLDQPSAATSPAAILGR